DRPNVKFSNSPGKESIGGHLRVYGRDDVLVVADAAEPPQGELLFVKLVENGRVVYGESFPEQMARADATWEEYKRWEMSPRLAWGMRRVEGMRGSEGGAGRGGGGANKR